jgi:NAD(P)-dependent dehydrogenase (short-subunit alcohol dehydrogenase family)
MSIEGRVAVVTGGGRGIGRGIASRFLELGAAVLVASRSASDLEEAVALLDSSGRIAATECDVSDAAQVDGLFELCMSRFSRLDVLVCSHGIHEGVHSVLEYPLERWDEMMAINVRGTFLANAAAARIMVNQGGGGRIINITSTAALASVPHEAAYDTSKGAVQSLTRAVALDLAPYGITVNAIAPGWIETPMLPPAIRDEFVGVINPLRRFGRPADIAGAAAWLADSESGYVTGSTIVVDGGQLAALGFAQRFDTGPEPPGQPANLGSPTPEAG